MEDLFFILLLVSFFMVILGLISPQTSLFWVKSNQSRGKSILIYGVSTIIFFVAYGETANGNEDESKNNSVIVKSDSQRTYTSYDSTMIAIIPWDFGYPFDSLSYRPTKLSRSDIEQIEVLLIGAVSDYNNSLSSEHKAYLIDLDGKDYRKQLVAVVNSKGEKEIWINCLCNVGDDSWRRGVIIVSDGGPCFFNLKLNLATKEVFELVVNGFA